MAAPGGRAFHRPILVALLAVVLIIVGALVLLVGIVLALGLGFLGNLVAGTGGLLVGAALGAVVVIAGAIMLVAGLGLWHMRSWAWWLALLVVLLDLALSFQSSGLYGKVALGLIILYLLVVRRHFNQ